MPFLKISLLFFSSIFLNPLLAQEYFKRNDSVPVFDKLNSQYAKPWVGGLNHLQVSEIDFNLDGKNDLFVFDRSGFNISTFINNGTLNTIDYTFAPQYKDSFPDLHDWVLFRDYNCDGKMDIYTYSSGGAAVYKNTSTTQLSFQLVTNLIYSDFLPDDGINNSINLYISSTDIPVIDDVDGDGDLDILTFSILGTYLEYHKNLSMETYGVCDSLKFKLSNKCWGYFAENAANNSVTLNDTCDYNISNPQRMALISQQLDETTQTSKKHSGSTIFALDVDANGSKELVLGDVSFNNLLLLYNGDTTLNFTSSYMTFEDQNFPSNNISSVAVDMDVFPAAFYIDVNNDNVKDLLVTNNCYSGCENSKGLWLYLNVGTTNLPQFNFQKSNFLQDEMIELGERTNPVFFDYDGDGLMDLVIGNYGLYDKTLPLLYKSTLHLYHNIGSTNNPIYKLIDEDFAGLSSINLDLVGNKPVLGIYPTFGDLDNDGDKDMMIGDNAGNLHYFTNSAGVGNPANFVLSQPKYQSIDVGAFATPQLIDLNRDGKLDMVIGKENGYFSYFHNTGTVTVPFFTKTTDSLGYANVKHPMFFKGNSVPCIIDDNGYYIMYAGSASGNIFKFENIDGNLNGTFSLVDTNFLSIYEGINSSITMADINGSGYLDMIIGNQAGGVAFFKGAESVISVNELNEGSSVSLYPNPSDGNVVIDVSNSSLKKSSIEVFDLMGKSQFKKEVNSCRTQLKLNYLPQGIYLIKFSNNKGNKVVKWIKK